MGDIPCTVTDSAFWRATLAVRESDQFGVARERLRSALSTFRQRARSLADEIRKDLPGLTLHDITHLDALWETAATVTGPCYELTPTEAFVLGGAILIHDLGLSLAAVDGGVAKLRTDPRWADLVTYEYQDTYQRKPLLSEFQNPEEEIRKKVLFSLLRQIHAEVAENLVFISFSARDGADPIHLVDDPELRQSFGRLIGHIAHSHWWSLPEVEDKLHRVVGAPVWCPPAWTIDPLKVACILRVADAAQLDSRRAPMFVRALTHLDASQKEHWDFQSKLNKPYLAEDSLVFTSGQTFSLAEASAWWLCLETLRMVDRELRSVDSLFSEKGLSRFAARRVAGIDSPERLISYVQPEGWFPINAMIHVTDLPRVIRSIAGEELYGNKPEVALRELIQNASDAVRARKIFEKRQPMYGAIRVVLLDQTEGEYWLEVSDNGLGMSTRVLTDFLLDFGRTFWGSPQMQEEFPGLLSTGISATGKYGIGFFSVFMVADHVEVITRRSDAAVRDTMVLEFGAGLRGRPILRPASDSELLLDGGTRVRLRLKLNPYSEGGMLFERGKDTPKSLVSLCRDLCPSLDVDLQTSERGQEENALTAEDWITMDGQEFLARMRILTHSRHIDEKGLQDLKERAANNLRVIRGDDGAVLGRALITQGYALHSSRAFDLEGVVTVGGLRACGLTGIAGVLIGNVKRASRDVATPKLPYTALKLWAEEQAFLIPALWLTSERQAACAQYVRLCGGHTGPLPICINQGKWWSANDIETRENLPPEIVIIDHLSVEFEFKALDTYTLHEHVFVTQASGIPGLLQSRTRWPRNRYTNFTGGGGMSLDTLSGALIEAVASSWGVSMSAIAEKNNLEKEIDLSVGAEGEREIRTRGILLKRPAAKGEKQIEQIAARAQ